MKKLVVPIVAAGLLGGAGGVAADSVIDQPQSVTRVIQAPATSTSAVSDTAPSTAGQIYDASKDAVAYITATTPDGGATGTGFVISKDGEIVTNAHVVENANDIQVKVGDREAVAAEVIGV